MTITAKAQVVTISEKLRQSAAYMAIFCAAAFLYYLAGHFQYDEQAGRIGPDAWPKIVLGLRLATSGWQVGRIFFGAGPTKAEERPDHAFGVESEDHPRLAWLSNASTLRFAYILPPLGFLVATILYLAVIGYIGGYRQYWPLFLTSVIAPLALIFIFMKIVYLSLPLGQGPFKELS